MASKITPTKLGYCNCGEPLDFFGATDEGVNRIVGVCPQCDTKEVILTTGWVWGVIINKLTRAERILIRGKHG